MNRFDLIKRVQSRLIPKAPDPIVLVFKKARVG